MMCIRGYSSDILDAVNFDEQLEITSKLPPNTEHFEKSFNGIKIYCCLILISYA